MLTLPSTVIPRLAWLKRHSKPRTATISTGDGQALIEIGPLTVTVPCVGDLPHALAFDSSVLRSLAMVTPDGDIEVSYADGRITIGGISTPAEEADTVLLPRPPVRQSMQMALEF